VWMAARMVHTITWRHFSHGGALAGFAAGVSTMLGPLHQVGTAAFMAEALGANRHGGNSAINLMKRMGLAAQGLHHAPAAMPRLVDSSEGGDVLAPSGGVPDIVAALSSEGRAAVAGAEPLFAASAFATFARHHTRAIGELTRDQPYGSLSHPDRAKLAWERTAADRQTAFADDHLSAWLGAAPAATAVGHPLPEAAQSSLVLGRATSS